MFRQSQVVEYKENAFVINSELPVDSNLFQREIEMFSLMKYISFW